MMFSVVALLASAAALVSAQTNHQIVVGGSAGLLFTPNSITANIGDTVTFEFQQKNHSVTQSAFATPCALLVNTTTNQQGFDSGFVPVPANATAFPAWTLQVSVSTPIWFFCAQTGHCEQGMVGAINAPTSGPKTFAAFQALATGGNTTTSSSSGTTTNDGGIGASASGSPSTATSAATPTSGAGRIASTTGVALGAVAAAVFFFV